jgi:lambda family phage tail tape measure protein
MSQAAGNVNIVLGMNSVTFTEGIKKAQAELDKFAGKARSMGHTTVSSTQAASASLRAMQVQGGMTGNIRAAERFLATIPGVGAALKVAFPLVGGLALASLLVEMGQKVATFIKTVNGMPQVIQQGFRSLALSQKTANDELDVTNDKLQNSIDKLEHKPTDGLKLGMDEAKVSADHLAEAITGASDKLDELLSKNHITGMQALWGMWGTVSTAGVEGTAKYFKNKISTASSAYANDPSDKNHAAMVAAITDALHEATTTVAKEAAKRDAPASTAERFAGAAAGLSGPLSLRPDNSNVLYDAQGEANYYQGMLRSDKSTATNQALTKQQAADQAKKEAADLAKQQTEAAKAAATARVAAMQTALDAMKLQYGMSIKAVYDYWDGMKAGELAGGTAYNEIVKKQVTLAVEGATKAHEAIAKYQAEAMRSHEGDMSIGSTISRIGAMQDKSNLGAIKTQTEGYEQSNDAAADAAKNSAKRQELAIQQALGVTLTKQAAALQLAAVHAAEYRAQLDAIAANRKLNASLQDSPEKQKRDAQYAKQYADTQTDASNQAQIDSNAANPQRTSALVGASDALTEFVNASKDAAGMMRDIVSSTLNGLNNQIVNAMTGGKTNFKGVAISATKGIANAGLKTAEGSALNLLGFGGGGKMGSKGNPMYTRSADKPLGIPGADGKGADGATSDLAKVGGSLSGVLGKMGGGVSGFLGKAGGLLKMALPFLATGGPIDGPAIVGEQGPELYMPKSAGTIFPHQQLASALSSSGGGHTFNINVDAKGSTDPAQTRVQVMRGIQAAAPQIVASSLTASAEQNKRKPPTQRK